jgi:hypothetical protein
VVADVVAGFELEVVLGDVVGVVTCGAVVADGVVVAAVAGTVGVGTTVDPVGVVTTVEPVGRLDVDTEGVVVAVEVWRLALRRAETTVPDGLGTFVPDGTKAIVISWFWVKSNVPGSPETVTGFTFCARAFDQYTTCTSPFLPASGVPFGQRFPLV